MQMSRRLFVQTVCVKKVCAKDKDAKKETAP